MRVLPIWLTVRRMMIGAACGAAIGIVLHYLVARPVVHDPRFLVVFVGLMVVVGALAAGSLSASGWALLAGAIVGWIAFGRCRVEVRTVMEQNSKRSAHWTLHG